MNSFLNRTSDFPRKESRLSCIDLNRIRRSTSSIVSIIYPKDGDLRSRKVVTRSRGRPTGKYPSWKMGRMIQWESINELNDYRLLDANPAISGYLEQPLIIYYELNGEIYRHYPDVLAYSGKDKELREIKPASEAKRPEFVERTKLLTDELPNHGYSYRLVIAEDLAQQPRLDNALTLLKHGRAQISPISREQVRRTFLQTGAMNWGSVISGAFGPTGRQIICRLVLEGVVCFDIERHWTDETILHWVSHNSTSNGNNQYE